jgi:hypothetical protein
VSVLLIAAVVAVLGLLAWQSWLLRAMLVRLDYVTWVLSAVDEVELELASGDRSPRVVPLPERSGR